MDAPDPSFTREFDIVYCYGLLYHLPIPSNAIDWMAKRCRKLLLLETCVSYGERKPIHLCTEDKERRTQAFSGTGCWHN